MFLHGVRSELENPVTHEDLIWHFDLLMLRFAFIDRVGNEQAIRFLGEFRTEAEAYVDYLEELWESMREHMSPCGRLALEHGIQAYRGNARWSKKAIEELSKLEKK